MKNLLFVILSVIVLSSCTYRRADIHKLLDFCEDHGGLLELDSSIFTNGIEAECSDGEEINLGDIQ